MSDFSAQTMNEVLSACTAGAAEATAAIARAFDTQVEITVGKQGTLQAPPAPLLELDGPGLIVLMKTDQANVVLTMPGRLVPDWCAQPDASGASRLATLAQELEMNLLPESWLALDFQAKWVESLGDALGRGGVPQDAAVISCDADRGGVPQGTLNLVWPVNTPDDLFRSPRPGASGPVKDLIGKSLFGEVHLKPRPTLSLNSSDLPPFTRSLLRIKVPVVVTLAEKRQKLSRIVELGPGAIIQFEKSCEEMLDLEIGNRPVASGEAVKVGDKFGIRITSISLPDERFNPVKPTQASEL